MLKVIQEHFCAVFDTFFPRICCACTKPLLPVEEIVCMECNFDMTKARNYNDPNSKLNKKFWGRVNLGGVVAYYVFRKDSKVQHLIHQLKYKGKHEIGELIGVKLGNLLLEEDSIIKNVDLVVPIPLHYKKFKKRGYNQCDSFAKGIAETLNVKYSTNAVERITANESQTTKSKLDRWGNVAELFVVKDKSQLVGKHVLVVDDVITTGSTAEACLQTISEIENIKISFAAIAAVSKV